MSKFFKIPFAFQGDRKPVAEDTQPDGVVSYRQGFGFDYQLDYDQPNAKDIDREQMNQILYDITSAIGDAQRTGVATWSEAGKPYPKGAIVHYNKELYVSLNDANNNIPTGAGWSAISRQSDIATLTKYGITKLTSTLSNSESLAVTPKAVNDVSKTANSAQSRADSAYNLAKTKQDKLEFVGRGKVMREGAHGFGGVSSAREASNDVLLETAENPTEILHFSGGENTVSGIRYGVGMKLVRGSSGHGGFFAFDRDNLVFGRHTDPDEQIQVRTALHDGNTTIDKSGFLRASGSANALTESDRTSALGTSTTRVATQKLVNDVNTRTTTAQNRADSAQSRADSAYNLAQTKQDKLTFIGSGKVMKEGAWGLGEGGLNSNTVNLDFNDSKLYPSRGLSVLYSAKNVNGPTGGTGTYIISTKGSDAWEGQIGIQHSGRLFSRGKSSGNWGSWREYATTADSDRAYNRADDARTRAINAQSRADSAYTLANSKWTPQATTGSGNIARMSEVQKAQQAGIGYGQKWADVTSQRSAGTTYTNNTGKPIMVNILAKRTSASANVYVDGTSVGAVGGTTMTTSIIVPDRSNYKIDGVSYSLLRWYELR